MSLLQRFRDRAVERWPNIRRFLTIFSVLGLAVAVFLTLFFFNRIFISIEAGHSGVLWRRFLGGTDLKYVYREGFHIVAPWDKMTIYDMRIQQVPHRFAALSKDGLPMDVELSIRYRPVAGELPILHQNIGPDYAEKIVKPEVQAMVRFVFAQYSPEDIYTSEGFLLNVISQGALGEVIDRHILLDDLLVKKLTMPDAVRAAIDSKLVQQQAVFEYQYRLAREEREADRKRIEAAGIRDFQIEVMKGGAFDKYLRFEGIAATVDLASSQNAKMVVVGGAGDGLPLILNMPDTPEAAAGSTSPASKPGEPALRRQLKRPPAAPNPPAAESANEPAAIPDAGKPPAPASVGS